MAQPVYSTQFCKGSVSGSPVVLYTVPSGYIAVLRSIAAYNNTGSSQSVLLSPGVSGSSEGAFAKDDSLASGDVFQWEGRQVLNAGEQLIVAFPNATLAVMASGYLLEAD